VKCRADVREMACPCRGDVLAHSFSYRAWMRPCECARAVPGAAGRPSYGVHGCSVRNPALGPSIVASTVMVLAARRTDCGRWPLLDGLGAVVRSSPSTASLPATTTSLVVVVMGSPLVRLDGSGVELTLRLGSSARVRVDDGEPPAVVLDLGHSRVVIEPASDAVEVLAVVHALALSTLGLYRRLGGGVISDV
jgi:hypothetical protein